MNVHKYFDNKFKFAIQIIIKVMTKSFKYLHSKDFEKINQYKILFFFL